MTRQVLLVVNPTREEARSGALSLAQQLKARDISVFQALSTEGDHIAGIPVRENSTSINDFELVIVLGGLTDLLRRQTQRRFDKEVAGKAAQVWLAGDKLVMLAL
jgi:hypothetical protein